ncbi:MAG: AAA family ATPase [Anaerostipes sp.]|nr:AAA family ATPase [Anaerostipes sp.]
MPIRKNVVLKDLGELVEDTKQKLSHFVYEDTRLSVKFKNAFSDYIGQSGNSIEFEDTTAIITNSAGQKIYAPNQWFVLASYAVPLAKEVMLYREFTEAIIDNSLDELKSLCPKEIKEKKDVYQLMRAGEDKIQEKTAIATNLERIFIDEYKNSDYAETEAILNAKYLIRFMSDSKWWLGGKGIERTNDYYVSPTLGVLNLVNASQSYVATMTYAYVTNRNLYDALSTMTSADEAETDNGETVYDVLKHNLFGIHIKEQNDALSDERPHICIGWSALGDLSAIDSKEKLSELYDQYFQKNNRGRGQDIGQVWRFLSDVKIGDYVIYADDSVFHIGRIESDYYYDASANPAQSSDYTNNRKVVWLKKNLNRSMLSANLHNSLKTAMSIWSLNDYRAAVLDLLNGTYKKDEVADIEESDYKINFRTGLVSDYERNRIVFGAPGTGKSYKLKFDCENYVESSAGGYERVTFHPDYTYSQFVGAYKPITDSDGRIRYDFVPGPFMRVYVSALKSGRNLVPQPYVLLIEEINRAKVAAVFGDVFQLLDRDEYGVSEYEIQASEDIKKYLAQELGGNPSDYEKIRIPDNMFIWATMNSADQGVFPMDTAFKRRWNFEYLGINANEDGVQGSIMLGTDVTQDVEWNVLRKAINEKLAKEYKVNEDKLMGPFFLSKKALKTVSDTDDTIADTDRFMETFKNKVIMYLYEDAAKQHKHKLFSGCEDTTKYSAVCESFDRIGMQIFGEDFEEAYYKPQKGR